MTTKKAASNSVKRKFPTAQQKSKSQRGKKVTEHVIELDGAKLMGLLGGLAASIERSNDVIASIGHPQQQRQQDQSSPVSPSAPKQPMGSANETNTVRSPLPPLECIALNLVSKCRTIYGFSCHLREEIQDIHPTDGDFVPYEPSLKGLLEMATRMLDTAHDNMISSRNTIVSI